LLIIGGPFTKTKLLVEFCCFFFLGKSAEKNERGIKLQDERDKKKTNLTEFNVDGD